MAIFIIEHLGKKIEGEIFKFSLFLFYSYIKTNNMNKYKLNQKILSSTTSSTDNHLVQVYLTTIQDVVTRGGETRIMLGEGLWGCIPDRTLNNVVTCKKDIEPYFYRSVFNFQEQYKNNYSFSDIITKLKERKGILHVHHFANPKYLNVSYLEFAGKTESLREGTFKEYKSPKGYDSLRIMEGEVRQDVFRNLNDAYKYFEKRAIQLLK